MIATTPFTSQGNTLPDGARQLARRRPLPGGRAVVGGFLVAVAAVGIFAAWSGVTADSRERYVVARHDLAIGRKVTKADLAFQPMDLPPLVRSRSFQDPSLLVGSVVVGPVARGELVQASDVVSRPGGHVGRELSFRIDRARAVDGQLEPGEFVDVLASYGTGADAYTVTVLRGARLVQRSEPRRALDGAGDEVVTLAMPNGADALAMAHAVNAGTVTLVRAGGNLPDGRGEGAVYRAPGAEPSPR
jgi:Flp pilus assembly protein CpaB